MTAASSFAFWSVYVFGSVTPFLERVLFASSMAFLRLSRVALSATFPSVSLRVLPALSIPRLSWSFAPSSSFASLLSLTALSAALSAFAWASASSASVALAFLAEASCHASHSLGASLGTPLSALALLMAASSLSSSFGSLS